VLFFLPCGIGRGFTVLKPTFRFPPPTLVVISPPDNYLEVTADDVLYFMNFSGGGGGGPPFILQHLPILLITERKYLLLFITPSFRPRPSLPDATSFRFYTPPACLVLCLSYSFVFVSFMSPVRYFFCSPALPLISIPSSLLCTLLLRVRIFFLLWLG